LIELVGREEELELLLRRWSKAKTGEGQAVLLSGEAGIGKSRLTASLQIGLTASDKVDDFGVARDGNRLLAILVFDLQRVP
jgi:hypothetical protein